VREGPSEAEMADAEAALRDAETQLTLAYDSYQDATDASADDDIETAKEDYDWGVSYYQEQKALYEMGKISKTDHDWAMAEEQLAAPVLLGKLVSFLDH